MIKIRRIEESDTSDFIELTTIIRQETDFMLVLASEQFDYYKQRSVIKRIRNGESFEELFIAIDEEDHKLVGFISVKGGQFERNKFTAHFGMGILKDYWGQGIGNKLIEAVKIWCKENEIHRLELTVMMKNERAQNLYYNNGFRTYGFKKESLFVNNKFVDELEMFIVFPEEHPTLDLMK